MQHDFAAAHAYVLQAVALCDPEDMGRLGGCLNLLARIHLEDGRLEDADRVLVKAIALAQSADVSAAVGFMTVQRGEVALGLGEMRRVEELTRAGLANLTEDDYIPFCLGWTNLAEVALARAGTRRARPKLCAVWWAKHICTRVVSAYSWSPSPGSSCSTDRMKGSGGWQRGQ